MHWSSWCRRTGDLDTGRTCRKPATTSTDSTPRRLARARSVRRARPGPECRMIGLFGGSFDPVHHGHLIVGQVAREKLGLELLRFVPAREQPFKRGRHQSSPEDRAAMLSLSIKSTSGFA